MDNNYIDYTILSLFHFMLHFFIFCSFTYNNFPYFVNDHLVLGYTYFTGLSLLLDAWGTSKGEWLWDQAFFRLAVHEFQFVCGSSLLNNLVTYIDLVRSRLNRTLLYITLLVVVFKKIDFKLNSNSGWDKLLTS